MGSAGSPEAPERRMRSDAASNRQRIVDAAGVVFVEQGLDGSVEEVARLAKVGMGTLYRHFPTKEALVEELVRQLLDEVVMVVEAAVGEPAGLGLERCVWRVCELQSQHRGCQLRLWRRSGHEEYIQRARATISVLLNEAQLAGTIRRDVTREDISLVFTSIGALIEQTVSVAPNAWKRCLALIFAGLRPSEEILTQHPLSTSEVERMQSVRAQVHAAQKVTA